MSEGDAVKVCLRVRPLIHREQGEQVHLLWKADNNTISQVDGTRSFNFDRVFHSQETTCQVYQEVAVPIIRSALQGYNGTIFAYGQTSSGKTYTMMGTQENLGIIPQAVQEIFKIIQEIPSREFLLRVSYMEIYNETVTDLLCDDRKKKPLEIREDINRNVYVADLTEELVTVPEHVMQWIKKGEKNRHYGETKMNDHSSRSHTIFRMIVESRERNDPGNSENCDGAVMVSHLNLVDLAGSERASQTGAEGVRFKEGCNINRSLFILGQVIKKLSDGQVGGFINYRDSKLTRILQNSLGGNTKTVIICTITPVSFDETLSTLQFASTAKHVRNTPHVNEVLDDQALLKRYRKEIMDLKKQLEELEASSEIKTQAMAKEEHSQLLAEIKGLQKEREDRIWNLTNIVVASSHQSNEDQRVKRKRRVTWAPGKLQNSLCASGISPLDIGSQLSANFIKRPKVSEFSSIQEGDDSMCTEFSDFEDAGRAFDDFPQEADWNFGSKVTHREKATTLSHSLIDFSSASTSATKESSLQKCKVLEQKVAELENQLKKVSKEYEGEVEKRESLEKETAALKVQLKSKDGSDKLVQTEEQGMNSLEDKIQIVPVGGEQNPGDQLETCEKLTLLETDDERELEKLKHSTISTQTDGYCQIPVQEQDSNTIHDICREKIQMLEQKIADIEESSSPENDDPKYLMESLQICEALMAEKQSSQEELTIMQNNFDHLVAENESLKREIADLEKCLQEKHETHEFERLEKETQKEHETQLIHEISSLKKLVENAEEYNQELENDLENKSKLLKEHEIQMAELKKESEMLQKRVGYLDLSASLGDGEKLCEELFQMKQSLSDAETVTRDAQKEAAFLRSENLELKEKMDELSIRCERREKDALDYEKQLEIEKSNHKRMQTDLQKELQYAYNEINQLNGLMAGRVPKDLLSRVELDKKVADYSKQVASYLEEKQALEQEVSILLEFKSLPGEVENLKEQVQRTSEELDLLRNEKEQSASIINDQKHKLLEQIEQIEKLTGEVTHVQAKCQQAEQQYSELKMLHESLQERCTLLDEELNQKNSESECLLQEMEKLKHSVECMEQKELKTPVKELEELLKSSHVDKENLKVQVKNLSSEVTTLKQQNEKVSVLYKEKQELEEKFTGLVSEMEQLQQQLHVSAVNIMQPENTGAPSKLQELQEELKRVMQHRDELLVKVEDLEAEKNHLKQDLNENIELSIETQDELRTAQEELKQQKQLVADLRKQLSDCSGDASAEGEMQKNTLEEKILLMTQKLQENEKKCDTLTNEKNELESIHQSLISEMKLLEECMHSAELALSKVEEENNDLKQKLKGQLDSNEQDVPMNSTELKEGQTLDSELKRQVNQQNYVNCLQLQEQMLAVLQERDALLETLKNITSERDQLKLDLQENIEMSIDTQEELRAALEELKVKSQLLDSLNSQLNEIQVGENGHSTLLCEHLKQDAEKYSVQLNVEKSIRTELQCEVEEQHKKIKELETRLEEILRKLQETESKYEEMVETLELVTKEKEHLLSSTNSLANELSFYKLERITNDQEVQVSEELPANIDQLGTITRQEESERSQENLAQLQQQLYSVSYEKEELQQIIENLKTERFELLADLQRHGENEAVTSKEKSDLLNEIEKLNEQLKSLEAVRTFTEVDGFQEQRPEYAHMEVNILKDNVSRGPSLFEEIQEEKSENLCKLGLLQEELQKGALHRDELQRKLEKVLKENAQLKESLDSVSTFVIDLQEMIQQKDTEYQLLIQSKDKLEQEKIFLSSQVEGLLREMKETHSTLESLQNEKLKAERQLLDLQQQMEAIVEEQIYLKNVRFSEIEQGSQTENKDQEFHFNDPEQTHSKCDHEDVMQSNIDLSNNLEQLKTNLKNSEVELEMLRSEKYDREQKINHLQHKVELITEESENLKVAQQCLVSERDQINEELKKNFEKLSSLQEEVLQNANVQQELIQKKEELENEQLSLKCEIENLTKTFTGAQSKLESLQNEKLETEQQLKCTLQQMAEITQERDELKSAKEILTVEILSFKENKRSVEESQEIISENQEATQTHPVCSHVFGNNLKDMEEEIATLCKEKANLEEKLFSLQQHLEMTTNESAELKLTLQSLLSEKDQLKEDLRENVEMSIETQDDLRKAHDDLQQQRQEVEELMCQIAALEQKSTSVENKFQETLSLLKEVNGEKDLLEQSNQKLVLEVENLHNEIKDKEFALKELGKEKSEAEQKIVDLNVQLKTLLEERDQIELAKDKLHKQSFETQDELNCTREELQEQKKRVEKLTIELSFLEEKSTSLERELQEKIAMLNTAVEERQTLDQSKHEIEQVMEDLKSKSFDMEQAEKKMEAAAQKTLELANEINRITQEKDDLQHSKDNLEEETKKLREEMQQLKHEYKILSDEQIRKTSQLDALETELCQLHEKMHLSEASAQQLETDRASLQKQLQQYELDVASLRQEQEQFQQLLQRARSEKENIVASLQDQEKAVVQLQDELQASKKEHDESNAHLADKVKEVDELLQKISSLQEEMQQLHQLVKEEKMKNDDLCENVSLLEKQIRVLRLIQSESAQEEDELAERTETLEKKNQEWKDLMVNISTVYSNHNSLLNNLSCDLQSETQAQKQSMSFIKESLRSTLSSAFGEMQTEYVKLNTHMQTLLNKFKIIYRNAAVKEEHYNLVQDFECKLCAVQKQNDELLLQCQSLEQHGTKWSDDAAEELRFCELEFLNQLLYRKLEVMKLVEDGFAEVQIALNSMETDLEQEIKCKKDFNVWLQEFQGSELDTKKLSDGVQQENRRIAGVIQQLTKKLKMIAQSKTKQDTMKYINNLEADLQEKKAKHKELVRRMQQIAPSGDSNFIEEENARLRGALKNVQAELKKLQSRFQDLENELSSLRADAKQKEKRALLLEDKLRSSTAEFQLSEMQVKVNEKEKHLQAAQKEIQTLQEKVAMGAAPYKEEIDSLKSQVVRVEMGRMKLSKATEQQIASLKACIEDKEASIRKLKEQLRRAQKDTDTTVCAENSTSTPYPLTCGGGSGIVQSTAMLILQSENAALKREIAQYKKKCNQLSRNISSREDELKKQKSPETPTTLLSSLQEEVMSCSNTDPSRATPASSSKAEQIHCRIASPGKTGIPRKRVMSPAKTEMHKPQTMSPKKIERHSAPALSPAKNCLYRKRPASPLKSDGPLLSTLNASPCKKQSLPEKVDSPKDKFFDVRSKSLPYCPSKFFDNSNLGTLPDPCPPPTGSSISGVESDADLYAGSTNETSDFNNWWDRAGKNENPNDCKTS